MPCQGLLTEVFYRTFYRTLILNPGPVAQPQQGEPYTQDLELESYLAPNSM